MTGLAGPIWSCVAGRAYNPLALVAERFDVPELPEVETVVRDLRPLVLGRSVLAVEPSPHRLRQPWQSHWSELLRHHVFQAVQRRGKWIILQLNGGLRLVIHLGMTGQLTVTAQDQPLATHTHLRFRLDADLELRYRDIRRFGGATLFTDPVAVERFFVDQRLGPEPFDLEPQRWRQALATTTRSIKTVLLDQTIVAGVGNIYADESLFVARLHPARRACDLSRPEVDRLRQAIQKVLTFAIEKRGSTIRNYVGGSGLSGGYQDEFRVYGRTNEPCRRCRRPIVVLRLAGRASHHCPQCQPLEGATHKEKRRPAKAKKNQRNRVS